MDNVPLTPLKAIFLLRGLQVNLFPTEAPFFIQCQLVMFQKCHHIAFEHGKEYNVHSPERFALTRPLEISPRISSRHL